MQSDVEQIVPLILARAGLEKRLITVLESGIEMVHRGDRHIYRNVESRNAEIIMSSVSNRGSSTPN